MALAVSIFQKVLGSTWWKTVSKNRKRQETDEKRKTSDPRVSVHLPRGALQGGRRLKIVWGVCVALSFMEFSAKKYKITIAIVFFFFTFSWIRNKNSILTFKLVIEKWIFLFLGYFMNLFQNFFHFIHNYSFFLTQSWNIHIFYCYIVQNEMQ